MNRTTVAQSLLKLAKELTSGDIVGPGVPDGTGPYSGTSECPMTDLPEDDQIPTRRRKRRFMHTGPQDGTGPRGGTPECNLVAKTLIKLAKELTAGFHPKDDLLRGITFEELIDTVYSNEQTRDEKAVKKVFEELLKSVCQMPDMNSKAT